MIKTRNTVFDSLIIGVGYDSFSAISEEIK
jgi:hypothetical protein